jgi:hypothetical protein
MGEPVIIDRRAEVRIPCTAAMAVRVILRPGYIVTVLDVSAGGVSIQGGRPLRPGGIVQLRIASPVRALALTARVVRCAVWAIDPEVGVVYRAALQFDQRCNWLEMPPRDESVTVDLVGSGSNSRRADHTGTMSTA